MGFQLKWIGSIHPTPIKTTIADNYIVRINNDVVKITVIWNWVSDKQLEVRSARAAVNWRLFTLMSDNFIGHQCEGIIIAVIFYGYRYRYRCWWKRAFILDQGSSTFSGQGPLS